MGCEQYESLISHKNRIKELEDTLVHVLERLFVLEEKERDRERIEYQKEMALVSKDLDAMEDGTYEYGEL